MRKGRTKGGPNYVLDWTVRRIEFSVEVGKSAGIWMED